MSGSNNLAEPLELNLQREADDSVSVSPASSPETEAVVVRPATAERRETPTTTTAARAARARARARRRRNSRSADVGEDGNVGVCVASVLTLCGALLLYYASLYLIAAVGDHRSQQVAVYERYLLRWTEYIRREFEDENFEIAVDELIPQDQSTVVAISDSSSPTKSTDGGEDDIDSSSKSTDKGAPSALTWTRMRKSLHLADVEDLFEHDTARGSDVGIYKPLVFVAEVDILLDGGGQSKHLLNSPQNIDDTGDTLVQAETPDEKNDDAAGKKQEQKHIQNLVQTESGGAAERDERQVATAQVEQTSQDEQLVSHTRKLSTSTRARRLNGLGGGFPHLLSNRRATTSSSSSTPTKQGTSPPVKLPHGGDLFAASASNKSKAEQVAAALKSLLERNVSLRARVRGNGFPETRISAIPLAVTHVVPYTAVLKGLAESSRKESLKRRPLAFPLAHTGGCGKWTYDSQHKQLCVQTWTLSSVCLLYDRDKHTVGLSPPSRNFFHAVVGTSSSSQGPTAATSEQTDSGTANAQEDPSLQTPHSPALPGPSSFATVTPSALPGDVKADDGVMCGQPVYVPTAGPRGEIKKGGSLLAENYIDSLTLRELFGVQPPALFNVLASTGGDETDLPGGYTVEELMAAQGQHDGAFARHLDLVHDLLKGMEKEAETVAMQTASSASQKTSSITSASPPQINPKASQTTPQEIQSAKPSLVPVEHGGILRPVPALNPNLLSHPISLSSDPSSSILASSTLTGDSKKKWTTSSSSFSAQVKAIQDRVAAYNKWREAGAAAVLLQPAGREFARRLTIEIRSTADPYLVLRDMTSDKMDFGIQARTGWIIGFLLLVTSACVCLLPAVKVCSSIAEECSEMMAARRRATRQREEGDQEFVELDALAEAEVQAARVLEAE
ncbi:unnamed protein product [Amoebophrya sp. A25]|nr:unnamed protein product [Amoebophrya sp. A25]|eukprot:GSA25T00013392001.1